MNSKELQKCGNEIKKIAIFTGSSLSYFGGGERYVIELSNELILRGFDVTIFTQNFSYTQNKSFSDVKKLTKAKIILYPIVPFPFIPTFPLFSRSMISKLNEANIIYNMDESLFTNYLLYIYSKKRRIRYIYGMHIPLSFLFGNKAAKNKVNKMMWFFYRYVLRLFFRSKVQNIHILNEEQYKNLKKIGYNGNIYKIDNFVREPGLPIEVTRNRDDENFIVIFSALMDVYSKGVDFLRDIIVQTLENEPKIKFYITGGRGNANNILSFIIEKYPKNVFYFGFLNEKELANLRNKALLFISTSRIEAFPLAIIETQMHGIPCIAFDIPGPSEIVRNEFQGKLIQPFDLNCFAENIILFYKDWRDNKSRYLNNIKSIHDYTDRNFGKSVIIPKIIEMFNI
jgi:glycosyltransferase involved in cell wall biosynthesis